MDIGNKIRNARSNAKLTQEQAAEVLGVSRQTISNWENGRTYPDIVSVVRMSDLYHISLDRLLKEETPMTDYLEYLDESTNVVKSKKNLAKTILIAVYLFLWALALIVFWFFTDAADAMGYAVMYLWIVLPVMTFVTSAIIGVNNFFGRCKWFAPLAFGVMYMLSEYATFSAANMAEFHQFNLPEFGMIVSGAVFSLVGLGAGTLFRRCIARRNTEH